jgi:hypothetical protein
MSILADFAADIQKNEVDTATQEITMLKRISRKFRHNIELRCLCNNMIMRLTQEKEEWSQRTKHYLNISRRLSESSEPETPEEIPAFLRD